jgi:uncharacterized membrane protein HdeD (DUF308 family)
MESPLQRNQRVLARATFRFGRPILRDGLARMWWVVLIRAVASVLFGACTLAWPRHTALALVALFGGYALIDGAIALVISARHEGLRTRWWLALGGGASIAAGMFALARPVMMVLVLIAVMGAWLIVRGLTEVIGQTSLGEDAAGRRKRRHWSAYLNGAMSSLFGVALIAAPRIGALALIWAIGTWAIVHGLLMVPFALRLRSEHREIAPLSPGL